MDEEMLLQDKYLFYAELAKLVEAGLGMRDSLEAILETVPEASQREVVLSLQSSLLEGKSIVEAFDESPMEFLEMEKAIVEAGEKGGTLEGSFSRLSEYFQLLAMSRKSVLRSLIYPAILLHLGILVSAIPFQFMEEESSTMGFFSKLILTLLVVYLIGAICVFGVRFLLKKAPGDEGVDRWLGLVPFLGRARKDLALARFTKVYHGGVVSGLSMRQTVQMASCSAHSGMILAAGKNLEKTVEEGAFIGPELAKHEVFPKAFSRSYSTAEQAGALDVDLERWSQFFANDAEKSSQRLVAVLPQLMYLIVASFIAWKIISFFSSYYGMIEDHL